MKTRNVNLINQAKLLVAYEAGKNAAISGKSAVPFLCPIYMSMMEGLKVGEGIPYAKAWQRGYFAVVLNN